MMILSSRAVATAFASLLLMSTAFAQTSPPPAAAAPAATAAPAETAAPAKKAQKPRTAASLQCSKDADAKGIKGKERKKFMSECKKAAKDAAPKPN
jgi:phosphate-selective porin